MAQTNYSYIGKGKIKLDGREIGNATSLKLTVTTNDKKVGNYMVAGGGTYAQQSTPNDVKVSMSLVDFSPENLNQLYRGAMTMTELLKNPLQPFDAVANPVVNKQYDIESFQATSEVIEFEFEGINEFNGNTYKISIPQLKLGVPKDFSAIGDDFGRLEVEGDAISYQSQNGNTQYFSMQIVTKA